MTLKLNLENLQTKAKERTVRTQTIEYDLETLVKKIKRGIIKLDPDYQRRHRWSNTTSSSLIESLILNIPIPILYLSYDIDVDTNEEGARYSVIDGQQRLTAINNFFKNEYSLDGLNILDDLNGCFYKDLPPFLLRRLEERTIKCLRIDSTIDEQIKYDIFERLNSGSVKLESHELRNAVYRGRFNTLCKKLSEDKNFRILLQIKDNENAKVKKMEDVEIVLRFFSLINDQYKTYKKSKDNQFKDFLSEKLDKFNKLSNEDIKKQETVFKITMKLILEKFGNLAFAKYKYEEGNLKKQSNFNVAVFDALAVSFVSEVSLDKPLVTEKTVSDFKNLFKNDEFYESISGSYLDSSKIIHRIDTSRLLFK
uniref:DUF262 domain-containing protein n=1 Tax=Tenacibaculum finnmarkense TaxID=2781243 RepID=UPI001EFB8F10|nr:DUF262 domain-containing protein [Tenacibaculum finnmarkense]MCG8806490.1 DUF262 domain-containing protein [Tenacibaculum finnmarkense]MCG8857617.1 DUF262 domain-containing protein [Tenacibaculum finnmarkense]